MTHSILFVTVIRHIGWWDWKMSDYKGDPVFTLNPPTPGYQLENEGQITTSCGKEWKVLYILEVHTIKRTYAVCRYTHTHV